MSELLQINQELQREELIKKWGIRLGKQALSSDPDKQYEDMVPVPTNPHVFFINSLTLWSLKIDEVVKLKDVMVMFAHGEISGKKQEWRFIGTKKLVKQTVEGYNRVAKDMGWPPIDVVLACRGRSVDQLKKELEKERNSKGKTNKEGVVWFKTPFVSSSPPQIYPGLSGVDVGGVWEKGKGVLLLGGTAIEWQGLQRWQKYWLDHKEERALMRVPSWAKGKAS